MSGTLSQLDWALSYARKGRPVFPCKLDKSPYTTHGYKDASTDEKRIRKFWTRYPAASIGMPTGTTSGWLVLDIDPRNNGYQSLAVLVEEYGPLPATLHSKTGGGGDHYFFQVRGVEFTTTELAPGLDIKAEGGYVILPPSGHPSGGTYQWANEEKAVISDLPEWFEVLLKERKPPASSNGDADIKKIPAGRRNPWLFKRACGYRNKGDDHETIFQKLKVDYDKRCEHEPSYTDAKLRDIANRVEKKYAPARETAPETRDASDPGGVSKSDIPPSFDSTGTEEIPGRLPITEASNAERLVRKHQADLRYAYDRRVWCVWHGKVWYVDDAGAVMRRMGEVTRGIYCEAANEADELLRKALAKWAQKSESCHVQKSSVELAEHFHGIEVREFRIVFDTHDHLVNVENGTIEFQERSSE
jgi:hypothetical protein